MKNVIIIILMVCINPTAFAHVGSHSSNIAIKVIAPIIIDKIFSLQN